MTTHKNPKRTNPGGWVPVGVLAERVLIERSLAGSAIDTGEDIEKANALKALFGPIARMQRKSAPKKKGRR
jgi:hypothetical protein